MGWVGALEVFCGFNINKVEIKEKWNCAFNLNKVEMKVIENGQWCV